MKLIFERETNTSIEIVNRNSISNVTPKWKHQVKSGNSLCVASHTFKNSLSINKLFHIM